MLKNCFFSLPSLFPSLIYLLKIICYASFACPIKLTQITGICQQKLKKFFHFFLFCRYFLFRKQNKTHTRRSAMTLAKESPPYSVVTYPGGCSKRPYSSYTRLFPTEIGKASKRASSLRLSPKARVWL